jgi:hypothetical protein
MAKISELPILTNPDTPTRFLALDVSSSPYSSKTVTLASLRDKIISLGVIDIGPTLVQNLNGSFDVATPIPTQTGNGGAFLTTDGNALSWATLNSTFPSQTGNTGKYLTTDGNSVSWGSIPKIPEQINHAGQYLTTNGTTSSWVALGASLLATQTGNSGKLLTTNGTTSSWVSLSLTLSSLTNVSLSSPTAGQVLTYNGTNWVNSTTVSASSGVSSISAGTGTAVSASTGSITIWSTVSAGSGLSSRATFSTSTSAISAGSSVSTTIVNAYKGYALLSIQVSAGAWVTLYSNASSQSADSSRTITTDPTPGSGIIAESISTVSNTTYFTPAIVGYNNEASPTTNIPVKIYNNSGSTNAITVTLTLIKLEA